MLLFVNRTAEDKIDVLDADTLKKVGNVAFRQDTHSGNIGPRAGGCFMGYGVVANCFDNTVSVIDSVTFKEIKTINVGAYPVALKSGGERLYIVCGDSDSIWTVDKNMDVVFVDKTVRFPFCIDKSDNDLCVCGFTGGEVHVYDGDKFTVKEKFCLIGYPMGVAYANGYPVISYNRDYKGMIYFKDKSIKVGKRIGKIVFFMDKLYAAVDDENILCLDLKGNILMGFETKEAIDDFIVCEKGIYISGLISGHIKRFSLKGESQITVNIGSSSKGLFLLP